jgi:hypothetical protein
MNWPTTEQVGSLTALSKDERKVFHKSPSLSRELLALFTYRIPSVSLISESGL